MKNILIVVDALSNSYINKQNCIDLIMPFISKLQKEYTNVKNVFSQGPYTEAALTPLVTGNDNLANGGNFFRGANEKTNIFKSFYCNNYKTFCYNQPIIYPNFQRGFLSDELIGYAYFFSAVWFYRLEYFAELKKINKFTQKDKHYCLKILDDNFSFWIEWLNMFINNDIEVSFINKYVEKNIDYNQILSKIEIQYSLYKKNKEEYLFDLFEKGENHPVMKIKNITMFNKSNNNIYSYITKNYENLIKKIIKIGKKTAYEKGLFFALVSDFLKNIPTNGIKESINILLHKFHYHLIKRNKRNYLNDMLSKKSNFKNEPSMKAYFDNFLDWSSNKDNYFANIHVSDIHSPPIFFTIESENLNEIDEELKIMDDLLDNLPKDYKGDIIYALSMRYVDYQLERFIKELLNRDNISNYNIIITADHGNSYNYFPLRRKLINTQYEENYHIPVILINDKQYNLDNSKFYTSKDITKTILSLNNIETKDYTGSNILENEGKSYAITEYLGGGCPDITRRDICFVIRDSKYSIAYKVKASQQFEEGSILSIFDRVNDKLELNDLKKSLPKSNYSYLLDILKNRFLQIVSEIK